MGCYQVEEESFYENTGIGNEATTVGIGEYLKSLKVKTHAPTHTHTMHTTQCTLHTYTMHTHTQMRKYNANHSIL